MKAGTRFSARVWIFSAISGLVLTNSYLLSAENSSVQSSSNNKQSTKTVRNPQKTLLNAIKREMNAARRISKPRTLVPQQEKRNSQIQQVGLTLDPRSLFQKRSQRPTQQSKKQKLPEIVRGGKRSTTTAQYRTATPQSNARPGQSEVQRQLEALYRRDGRTMPPMDLNSLPKTAGNQSAMGRGTLNSTTTPQTNSSSQNLVGSPNRNRYQPRPVTKKKWYDKFLPAKTKQSPRRLPQSNQIVKKAPVAPPVTEQPDNSALPELPPAPALPGSQSVVTGPEQPNDKTETTAKSLDELETEKREIAADKQDSTETFVPEVKSAEVTPENVATNDDFENLFPDMSEATADNLNKPLEKEKEKPVENPFSGLVLEEESLKKENEKQAEPTKPLEETTPQVAQEDVKKEVNPFEPQSDAPVVESDTPIVETPVAETPVVETPVAKNPVDPGKIVQSDEAPVAKIIEFDRRPTKRTSIKPKLKQILESKPDAPAPKIATSESKPIVPAPKITTSDRDSSVEKKLAIIASRGNIKGLKGFCPVALRDNRLLVDARPEFSSSFKSMNYQFASLENKLKFDREPAKYAPAAGGSDIVLLVDHQDDKEGSLDFASWYKGKLYLFSNKTNMDLFMKTPALYVGVE